jgi:hypothetical protein
MIPKSVSGTWLIVALAAVLLIPAWGWAGDFQFTLPDPWDGGAIDMRCQWTPGLADTPSQMKCEPIMVQPQPSCYRRMREAMRSANVYLKGQRNNAWEESSKWDQTMKDCVEDSK